MSSKVAKVVGSAIATLSSRIELKPLVTVYLPPLEIDVEGENSQQRSSSKQQKEVKGRGKDTAKRSQSNSAQSAATSSSSISRLSMW